MSPAALKALASGDTANFIAASTPGGIERQEKEGQIEQSFQDTLPIDNRHRKEFEKLGFVFGEKADDLFENVRFPAGWRKSVTEHSMWTDLLDDRGHKRAAIFYKAAFYDRAAHVWMERRFTVSQTYANVGETTETAYIHDALGKVNQRMEGLERPDWRHPDRAAQEALARKMDEAKATLRRWLAANYPDWEDVTAYWDEGGEG